MKKKLNIILSIALIASIASIVCLSINNRTLATDLKNTNNQIDAISTEKEALNSQIVDLQKQITDLQATISAEESLTNTSSTETTNNESNTTTLTNEDLMNKVNENSDSNSTLENSTNETKTDEEIAAEKEKIQNMTPEEREKYLEESQSKMKVTILEDGL